MLRKTKRIELFDADMLEASMRPQRNAAENSMRRNQNLQR